MPRRATSRDARLHCNEHVQAQSSHIGLGNPRRRCVRHLLASWPRCGCTHSGPVLSGSYGCLDRLKPTDVQELYRRISRAVRWVCMDATRTPEPHRSQWIECFQNTTDCAIAQVHKNSDGSDAARRDLGRHKGSRDRSASPLKTGTTTCWRTQ
jgi:hypothetical protein